jgi:hypothetical protein
MPRFWQVGLQPWPVASRACAWQETQRAAYLLSRLPPGGNEKYASGPDLVGRCTEIRAMTRI